MSVRLPKKQDGEKREFYRCKTEACGRVYFRDYVPYSLSNPILSLSCGHSPYGMQAITRAEFDAAIRARSSEPAKSGEKE